jgi:hypothetical protein
MKKAVKFDSLLCFLANFAKVDTRSFHISRLLGIRTCQIQHIETTIQMNLPIYLKRS